MLARNPHATAYHSYICVRLAVVAFVLSRVCALLLFGDQMPAGDWYDLGAALEGGWSCAVGFGASMLSTVIGLTTGVCLALTAEPSGKGFVLRIR